MKLKLYHYWRSSSSWRVRWALAIKKITCEFVVIDLLSGEVEGPEHRKRNPLGYVPVFEVQLGGHSSPVYLGESLAMIEWLEEVQPEPRLLPGDALTRAKIRQLAEVINAGTQPLQNINAQDQHTQDPAEKKLWTQFWIQNGLQAYETLVQSSAGRFSVGDSITLADLCLIPQVYNAKRYDLSLAPYPILQRIYDAALATVECQASAPERFDPKL